MSKDNSTRSFILFFIVGALIVGIIIAVPFIFDFSDYNEDSYRYNYFDFTQMDGIWTTSVTYGGNLLMTALRNGPRDLEDIPVTGNIAAFRDDNEFMYITFDPRPENHNGFVTMANAEISPNLVIHFGKDILPACTVNTTDCADIDIVTCDSTDEAVVFINRVPETSVRIVGRCAIISGMDDDLVRAADRFMYGMYGIMR